MSPPEWWGPPRWRRRPWRPAGRHHQPPARRSGRCVDQDGAHDATVDSAERPSDRLNQLGIVVAETTDTWADRVVRDGAARRWSQQRGELADVFAFGIEPPIEGVGREDDRHAVMNPVHVGAGGCGDDGAGTD